MKKKTEDLINAKIMDIEQEMEKMHTTHLYYLTIQWGVKVAQVQVLNEILNGVKQLK